MIRVHSTRLFPKHQGADRYQITGIASNCDWVVLSDRQQPQTHILKRVSTDQPQSIFLSMRYHPAALKFFTEQILPKITSPFILISGSEDITLPNQIDKRWPPLSQKEQNYIATILRNPNLRHWAVENLDTIDHHPLMSPLPVGMVYTNPPKIREYLKVSTVPPLSSRPIKVLCGHRVREGAQWMLRKEITDMARTSWSKWSTMLEEDIPEVNFLKLIEEHAFVLCAEGGGLDPSPKAWQAILHGAIPIIKKNALYDAYHQLPVAFVDEWTPDCITASKLLDWRASLIPKYDTYENRKEVLRRLSVDYWWYYINKVATG